MALSSPTHAFTCFSLQHGGKKKELTFSRWRRRTILCPVSHSLWVPQLHCSPALGPAGHSDVVFSFSITNNSSRGSWRKNNATESVFEQWPCVKARGRPEIYRAKGRQTTAAAVVTTFHLDGTQQEGKREASPICLLCLLPASPAGPLIGKTILKRHCGTARHHVMFEISSRGSIVQMGGVLGMRPTQWNIDLIGRRRESFWATFSSVALGADRFSSFIFNAPRRVGLICPSRNDLTPRRPITLSTLCCRRVFSTYLPSHQKTDLSGPVSRKRRINRRRHLFVWFPPWIEFRQWLLNNTGTFVAGFQTN